MKKIFNLFLLCIAVFSLYGQEAGSNTVYTQDDLQWLNNLYTPGVYMTDDSIFINEEVNDLLSSNSLRSNFYKSEYTWQDAISYLQQKELKKGFWHLIHLYDLNEYNQDKVVKTVLTYDAVFKMDEVLVSSFYTYCYTDPQIGEIVNGQPVVHAPHILEKKLRIVKEIIDHIKRLKNQGIVKS